MPRTELVRLVPQAEAGLWQRVRGTVAAARSYWSGPLTSRSPELARLFGEAPASSGASVDHRTAFRVAAFLSGVSTISCDLAAFPLIVMRRLSAGGKVRDPKHRLYRLLHMQPNAETTSFLWRQGMFAQAAAFGNSYAEIERDAVGRPYALWQLDPSSVSVQREGDTLRYRVVNPSGSEVFLDPRNMIHFRGPSIDGALGLDVVRHAREALGLALAAEEFGGTFFGNGSAFGGVLTFPGPKPPEMSDENYRAQLEARHQGVKRAHKLLALYGGATFTPVGVAPEHAQFLETRTFQIREVARVLRLPPHKLGDLADATFSNVAQQNLDYYSSCLRTWLVMAEQELTSKLLMPSEEDTIAIEHVVEGFLRVDPTARAEFYKSMVDSGVMTVDECRELENLPPRGTGGQ